MPLHIVELFISWNKEQEYLVRWGNSLSMTSVFQIGSGKGDSCYHCWINVYTDNLNHPLQATCVGCCVGGAWVNSLSYADDMVLLAPTVTALQTLLEVCRAYAGPHDNVYNTTKTVCMLVRSKQSQGCFGRISRLRDKGHGFVDEFRCLGDVMTADNRDNNIGKLFRRKNGQEVLICTYGGKNPIVQVILLSNLWMCSLASFIPKLYLKTYWQL